MPPFPPVSSKANSLAMSAGPLRAQSTTKFAVCAGLGWRRTHGCRRTCGRSEGNGIHTRRQKESNRSYRNRRKVRDCGPSTRAKSRERATARARSDRASGSEYYWRNSCADGVRSKRAVDCRQSANFCGSLDWESEHNFERRQRNKRGETLQPKGK